MAGVPGVLEGKWKERPGARLGAFVRARSSRAPCAWLRSEQFGMGATGEFGARK